jgi:hypothetical protein
MRNYLVLIFSLAAFSAASAADSATTPAPAKAAIPALAAAPTPVTLPNYGFRIDPLDAGTATPLSPALQMYLPMAPLPSNNNLTFSPNVYVQVTPYLGTMKDYISDSAAKMKDGGYIIRAQNSLNPEEWDLEYIAVLNGLAMHWYAKAIYSGHRIYYAAGGVPDEMWAMYGDKLRACVNSLQATGTAPELKVVMPQAPVTAPPAGSMPVPAPAASMAPAAKSGAGTSTK